jgi:hypothetical protein
MGVRTELLGRHVRCPHCSQVVLAPAPATTNAASQPAKQFSHTAPTPPTASAPVPPVEKEVTRAADSTHHEEGEITFDKKEAADSILSAENESDDEVFSSQTGNKVPAPVVPAPDPEVPGAPHPHGASASKIPTLELRTPVEIIPAPISASTLLPLSPPPEQGTASIPAPSTPTNPFAFGPSEPPLPAQQLLVPSDQVTTGAEALTTKGDEGHDAARARKPGAVDETRRSRLLLYVLIPYAAIMTLLAIYGLFFRKADTLDPGHPLSTIPDNFGEFDPAARKKVSQLKLDFDAPLPAVQQAGLGERIQIGQLEIEPVTVEKRPLNIIKEGGGDRQRRTTRFNSLVLRLRVTNTSADVPIFPLDPAYTRAAKMDDRPAMRLAIGRQMLYGGAISWPFGDGVKREYEEAQSLDDQPLKPGETREYVVFTNEDAGLAQVVTKATEPLLWRVQVRRGVIEFRGKEVPVSAIIGIEFKPSDVRNLD